LNDLNYLNELNHTQSHADLPSPERARALIGLRVNNPVMR